MVGQVPDPVPLPGPVSTLLRTSGTTGEPRLAVHALEAHVRAARAANEFLGLGAEDSWLLSLPVHHVGGLQIVFRTLLSGAVLAIAPEGTALDAALAQLAPTHVSLVATQLRRLLEERESARRLAGMKAVLVGGGPLSAGLRARALDAGVPLVVSYGATETTALVAATRDPEVIRRPGSAGRLLTGRSVRIAQDGEICVGGDALFRGYLARGTLHDAPADGVRTRDLGALDEDGVLYVHGRMDRLLISGGENVQPEEIEAALLAVQGVQRAAVVAVPDAEYGARPVAFVRCTGLTSAALASALRKALPGFKVPDAFYAWPEGETASLKPDLRRLARLAADPTARAQLVRL